MQALARKAGALWIGSRATRLDVPGRRLHVEGAPPIDGPSISGRRSAPGAPPVVNDHGDPDYDRGVLERLADLAADADAWLAESEAAVPRLATYRRRLERAAQRAAAGDQRYVASPRVDSFHSAWFELHEDLILLAGRTRADEEAAGRA